MAITKKSFGTTSDQQETTLYAITNSNGCVLEVSNYGATWVGFKVPYQGEELDLLLGHDHVTPYENPVCHFGSIVGRNANRIKDGRYELEGKTYQIVQNNNGNNLHSGPNFWGTRIWDTIELEHINSVSFMIDSEDMEQGYPSNMEMIVTYTLTEDNTVIISYDASSEDTTILNPTNHAYFNLNGHNSGSVKKHLLYVDSTKVTEVDNDVSTGVLLDVKGTKFDFTTQKEIEHDLDHNWCEEPHHNINQPRITCIGDQTNITLNVYTDMPGIQIYTGIYIDEFEGKNGASYEESTGVCFESQYYVNAINIDSPLFKKPILAPNEVFHSETRYQFKL